MKSPDQKTVQPSKALFNSVPSMSSSVTKGNDNVRRHKYAAHFKFFVPNKKAGEVFFVVKWWKYFSIVIKLFII